MPLTSLFAAAGGLRADVRADIASGVGVDAAVHIAGLAQGFSVLAHMTGPSWHVPDRFAWMLNSWDEKHGGEYSGAKLGVRRIQLCPDGVRVELDRTTWRDARAAHEQLPGAAQAELRADVLLAVRSGAPLQLPNIAVVHCVLQTADSHIVLARRSSRVHYSAGRWSCSYEEGIEPEKDGSAPIVAAAIRGAAEEFAAAPPALQAFPVALAIEWPIMNPALVVYVRTRQTIEEVQQSYDPQEADAVEGVPLELMALARVAKSAVFPGGTSWHPTSRYRLVCAMVFAFGAGAALDALRRA